MLHILLKRFLIKSTQAQTLLPYTHTIPIYLGGFLIKSVWIKNLLFHTQRVSNCSELRLAFPLTYVQTSQLRTKLFTLTITCFKTRSRENNEISGSDSTILFCGLNKVHHHVHIYGKRQQRKSKLISMPTGLCWKGCFLKRCKCSCYRIEINLLL